MEIRSNTPINFKSGLNTKILLKEHFINVDKQQRLLMEDYGINANFNGNKAVAVAIQKCANLFENISQKFNLALTVPPFIYVYNKEDAEDDKSYNDFCLYDTKKVIKDEYPFPAGSLFFKNYGSLRQVDKTTEDLYKNKAISSNHFLTKFVHEWLHFLHLDYLYKKYGYSGDCEYMKTLYPQKEHHEQYTDFFNKTLTKEENEIVAEQLGMYSTLPQNQYFEVFSETYTKLICDSLSKDCTTLVSNPMDLLKNTPKPFQRIVEKVTNFDE